MQSKRFPWFGIFLVVVGAVLLLDRLQIFAFGWPRMAWILFAACGFGMVILGFVREQRGKVFWGTVIFLYGVLFLLRYYDAFEFHRHLFFPATLVIFGMAFIMRVIYAPKDWSLLIPAVACVGLGLLLVFSELGYIYHYDVWYYLRTYWPVLLIVFGISLLFRRT